MAENFTNANLVDVPASDTDFYTAPGSTQSVVHNLNVSNKDSSERTVTIKVVKSGGSPTVVIANAIPIPPNDSFYFEKQINLAAGDKITLAASAVSTLDAFASVLEIT